MRWTLITLTLDPCLYFLPFVASEAKLVPGGRGCAGLVLLDVDDSVQGGNDRRQSKMMELKQGLRFGK